MAHRRVRVENVNEAMKSVCTKRMVVYFTFGSRKIKVRAEHDAACRISRSFLVAECRSMQAVLRAWGMWVKLGERLGALVCTYGLLLLAWRWVDFQVFLLLAGSVMPA